MQEAVFQLRRGTVVFAPPTLLTVLRTFLPEWDDNRYLRSSFLYLYLYFIYYLLNKKFQNLYFIH